MFISVSKVEHVFYLNVSIFKFIYLINTQSVKMCFLLVFLPSLRFLNIVLAVVCYNYLSSCFSYLNFF